MPLIYFFLSKNNAIYFFVKIWGILFFSWDPVPPLSYAFAYVIEFLSQKKCPKCLTKVGEVSQPKGTKSKCA